jgi:hypothetical protein
MEIDITADIKSNEKVNCRDMMVAMAICEIDIKTATAVLQITQHLRDKQKYTKRRKGQPSKNVAR